LSSNKRVVKFRKRRSANIGIIVFLIMFIYISINVYIYFTKEHISIYEVKKGSTAEDNLITGLILRDETFVYSDKAGYISYFQKEGSRVSKNASLFSIDDNSQILDYITNSENPITLSKENNAEIKYEIQSFQKSFSDDNFIAVYEFKENAQSTVLDLLNQTMIDHGQEVQEETGYTYTYDVFQSKASGIISYYADSFEAVTQDNVSQDSFASDSYERTSLRTTEMVTQNSPVCKLITSELWSIILPLTPDQYEKLVGKEQVSFTILKDDFKTSSNLILIKKGTDYYAKLSLEKLLSNYLEDRYLDIELDFGTVEGLKIPKSSIIEKDFYLVPIKYFTKGANSDNDGLTVETYDKKDGTVSYSFIPTDIYDQDDTYGYVDAKQFSIATSIKLPDSADSYKLTKMDKLIGVYNVNMGYAVFKRIEILYDNEEYCIVKEDTSRGLSVYDHIALDGTTAVEQKIIY